MQRDLDRCCNLADEWPFPADGRLRHSVTMLPLVIIFVLGVGNFAMHKAVLESGHPLLGQMPWFVHMLSGRLTLATEFMVLLAAMMLAANGWPLLVWAYVAYSGLNAVAAWLILTDQV